MASAPEFDPTAIAPGPDDDLFVEQPVITGIDDFAGLDPVAKWDTVPQFDFADKQSAEAVLELLSEEAQDVRHQLAHTLRYLKLAVRAAHEADVLSKKKIAAHAGLTKQTVLDMLNTNDSRGQSALEAKVSVPALGPTTRLTQASSSRPKTSGTVKSARESRLAEHPWRR